jgi:AhpC/TSA family
MTLQEKLDTIRERSKLRVPPETQAIMQRSIDDLRAGGIMDRVVRVGQRAPEFALPNVDGRTVSLGELLARGPLVLSFYRGRW